jgi:hypothetical protein
VEEESDNSDRNPGCRFFAGGTEPFDAFGYTKANFEKLKSCAGNVRILCMRIVVWGVEKFLWVRILMSLLMRGFVRIVF